jgi:predicted DNA-binding transcriptional regulator AlpA
MTLNIEAQDGGGAHADYPSSAGTVTLVQADEVRAIFGGVSDVWLWRHMKDGTIPRPIIIGNRRFWRRDEIAQVIEARSAARTEAA